MKEQDLGQLFITGISGLSLGAAESEFLKRNQIGGVLLFSHNYESPAQLAELTNSIQETNKEKPLFICVDQEGGRVQRFKKGFSRIPTMTALGKLGSPSKCFDLFQVVAKELSSCGINMNFAPVCDIHSNPLNKVIGDRSFGDHPEIVCLFITSVIRALQKNNVIACSKHFPGHGDTLKDSHYALPLIKKSWKEISEFELLPFKKAIKSGVEMMMVAHLQVDCLDEKLPTTLSKSIYQKLREELNFKGVIVSDDMEMKAIADHYSYGQAATLTLGAGADIVEYRSIESCMEAYQGVLSAFHRGELDQHSLTKSLERVNRLKSKYLSHTKPVYIPDIAGSLNQPEEKEIVEEIHRLIEAL